MLDTALSLSQVQAPSIIKSLYTKVGSESYRVELKYKVNGFFILRPISGEPYKYILATAEQVKAMRLFPIFEVHHG
jgi:hypothetical protein